VFPSDSLVSIDERSCEDEEVSPKENGVTFGLKPTIHITQIDNFFLDFNDFSLYK
jgi:hypothetical protein